MLNDSITARYKKASNNIKKKINATGIWKYFEKLWKKGKQMGELTASYHRKTIKKISKIIQQSVWLTLQKTNSRK